MQYSISTRLNELAAFVVSLILFAAFWMQIADNELPCPLCLLQRVGFCGVLIGLLLNVHYNVRPSHYGIMGLSALFGMAVSLRQISLHIIPPDPGYGSAILGFHLYTWAFISFFAVLLGSSLMLIFERQFNAMPTPALKVAVSKFGKVITLFVLLLIVANLATVLLECGLSECPDNPTAYHL